MKGAYSGEAGIDWQLAKDACQFYGTPNDCQGKLTVINQSNNKVKVRTLSTQNPTRQRKNIGLLKPTSIMLSARIPPHSEVQAIASLQLPAHTAPGQYQAAVICGKQKVPIEIKILEHREMLIEPSHIRVQGECGELIHSKLTITNQGNVPLNIKDVGMVWLREHDWVGRTLVYTIRETDPKDSLNDFGNRLLQTFRDEIIPPAKIKFSPTNHQKEAIDTLTPGNAVERTLNLTLPTALKKGRRYLGFIKINESRIWLEVYCSGSRSTTKKEKQA